MENKLEFINPEKLARISTMELKARFVVEGFLTGLHKSPYHGFSIEFSEHRPYLPGDDFRKLDWKILGKTEKYFIKQFEDETNLTSHIFIDTSASMGFVSDENKITKLKYASYLAAALSYLMIHQKDAVGLGLYDKTMHTFINPKTSNLHLKRLLVTLENLKPNEETDAAISILPFVEKIKRKGLIILISDLFDKMENLLKLFKQFRYNGHEVIVFHILDEQEIEINYSGNSEFRDIETGELVKTIPSQIKNEYKTAVENYISKIKESCFQHKIDYNILTTSTSFDKALLQYLNKRNQLF